MKGTHRTHVVFRGFGQDEPESPFSLAGVIMAFLGGGCGRFEGSY